MLSAEPRWGTVFMSKINIVDAYMRVFILTDNLTRIYFIVPYHLTDTDTLIGFHISLLMGYVGSG